MRLLACIRMSATVLLTMIVHGIVASTGNGQTRVADTNVAGIESSSTTFPEQPDDGLLTMNAVIQLPDGSPAAGAFVESQYQWLRRRQGVVRADAAGRATVRDLFGNGALIHVRSSDDLFQATLRIDAQSTRIEFAKPIVIKLVPSVVHRVIVDFEGQPVADAHVIASGQLFKVRGKTGPDGIVDLKLPADDELKSVDALDPDRAVAGIGDWSRAIRSDSTRLSLQPSSPFLIRVIDPEGRPAIGVDFGFDLNAEDVGWVQSRYFSSARVRTNEQGEANVTWMPKCRLTYVDATIVGSNWVIDEIDDKEISNRMITIKVRRQRTVEGRLRMPDGVSARGILISANSFGPGHRGTDPHARARADGSFSLNTVSDYGFLIGTSDREWASQPWTGLIMATDRDEPVGIEIPVQSATPMQIRVTRGPTEEPQPEAWVFLSDQERSFQWVNSCGEQKSALGRVGSWLRTNAQGIAVCGVAQGPINLRLSSGSWSEGRDLKVKSAAPMEIRFHRPWTGIRKIVAPLLRNGDRYRPSSKLVAFAWTQFVGNAKSHQPTVGEDSVELNFDHESATVLVIDRDAQLYGSGQIDAGTASLEIAMLPTATCSGTIVDENGNPMAKRMLKLIATVQPTASVTETVLTDGEGQFLLSGVPGGVQLRLVLINEEGQVTYELPLNDHQFNSGEKYDAGKIQATRSTPKN